MPDGKENTIVVLSPGFPENENDSTCLPSQQSFVRCVTKQFPEVVVKVISFQYPFKSSEYDWNNVAVTALGGNNKGGINRLLLWRKAWKKLETLHKREKITGILSLWCGECCYLGKRFADKFKLPHYCWILGQDAKKENRYVSRIRPTANSLIAMSDFLQNEFERNHGIRPAHVITNGIDETEGERETDKDIDIIGVGSLIPLKQYDLFVDCVNELKASIPSIRSVLIGKGPLQDLLNKKIDSLGLAESIKLIGEVSHSEVIKQLSRSRIHLHPSSYEGFSGACLEALYAGCHVISFTKPMKEDIPHWHVVKDFAEMVKKTKEILKEENDFRSVIPYTMEKSAALIISLLNSKSQ